jgi:hypothetical protein
MPPTQAKVGFGTLLQRGDGQAPENFNTVNELLSIKGPGLTRAMIAATNMSSVNGREESIPSGILNTGSIDFQVSYVRGDVQHAGLLTDIKNGTLRNFKVIFPDDPTNPVAFAAYVEKAEPDYPIAEKRTLSLSLNITGDFTGL